MKKDEKCHDCGVHIGEVHKPGCDWEECPFCGRQLLSCECCYEKLGIDAYSEPTYSNGLTDIEMDAWENMLNEKGLIKFGDEVRFD